MIEPDELELRVGAQHLLVDLNYGWNATRSGNRRPGVAMRGGRLGPGSLLLTKGQPSDAAIQDLLTRGFVEPVGETFPQPIRLTHRGRRYCQQHLSHVFQPAHA